MKVDIIGGGFAVPKQATLAGVPVIQLLPAGSAEIMPAADWGYLGTARLQSELDALLPMALARGWRRDEQALARVFGNGNGLAANAVATAALELATRQTGNCMGRAAA